MNTSAALCLLTAARDDAVLASWAAVFDEHKMSPSCDVSPYDCWEVLQGFISSGIVSSDAHSSANIKAAFFNGSRPTTGQIQEVLGRLKILRANREPTQEPVVSNAKPPMSAFSPSSSIAPVERPGRLQSPSNRNALGPSAPRPGLAAFQDQRAVAAPARFGALEPAPGPARPSMAAPRKEMACRKIDASTYRGEGVFNYKQSCCDVDLAFEDLGIEDSYENDPEEGGGVLQEFMFRSVCQLCDRVFTVSCAQRVPG